MSDLLPCPFCECTNITFYFYADSDGAVKTASLTCSDCRCSIEDSILIDLNADIQDWKVLREKIKKSITDTWNTRTDNSLKSALSIIRQAYGLGFFHVNYDSGVDHSRLCRSVSELIKTVGID